jgi:aminopeptidase
VTDAAVARLADLAVVVGANVQPGQIVGVTAELEQHDLARAIAAAAYDRGAKFVDVWYIDPLLKRARIEFAPDDTLEFVPPWYGRRILQLGEERGANIVIRGATVPGALDGLDAKRSGRDQLPRIKESNVIVNERTVNWTIVAYPTVPWARLCFPDLDEEAALARLWEQVEHVSRLDESDPLAAWEERIEALERAAAAMNDGGFDAIHFEGEGTDLTIGLLPTSIWRMARWSTVDGIRHMPNVPSEEVFTSPDPERVDGHVRSTKPLVLSDGTVVRGLEVRFEGGRAVEIDAAEGGEVLRTRAAIDAGASRLGEVALVDRESRIGQLGTVFYETLLDENAASHIALGSGFTWAVETDEDRARINESAVHIDFMIGSNDVDVTGVTEDGERVPVLRGGAWQLSPVVAV